jgi:hypothetical protein
MPEAIRPPDPASFHGVAVCGINDRTVRVTPGPYTHRYGVLSPFEHTVAWSFLPSWQGEVEL